MIPPPMEVSPHETAVLGSFMRAFLRWKGRDLATPVLAGTMDTVARAVGHASPSSGTRPRGDHGSSLPPTMATLTLRSHRAPSRG